MLWLIRLIIEYIIIEYIPDITIEEPFTLH